MDSDFSWTLFSKWVNSSGQFRQTEFLNQNDPNKAKKYKIFMETRDSSKCDPETVCIQAYHVICYITNYQGYPWICGLCYGL